jgi:pyruvate formate lyase activating enzyme
MKIGGLQKISLLDYPNKLSAIIWTVGCNLCCPFCYNKQLLSDKNIKKISEDEIFSFLKKRIGKLEAVSITGGEPLLQKDISNFIKKIKNLGYLIKIDTNGTFPIVLNDLIERNLIDYISMDVKAPKKKYSYLCGKKVEINKIQKSIDLIKNSSIEYEFKTTIIPGMLEKKDIIKIAVWLNGAKQFYLQQFKNDTSLISKELEIIKPYSKKYLYEIIEEIKPNFEKCNVRGDKIDC